MPRETTACLSSDLSSLFSIPFQDTGHHGFQKHPFFVFLSHLVFPSPLFSLGARPATCSNYFCTSIVVVQCFSFPSIQPRISKVPSLKISSKDSNRCFPMVCFSSYFFRTLSFVAWRVHISFNQTFSQN